MGNWLRRQGAEEALKRLKKRAVRDVFWDRSDVNINLKHIRIPMYNVGGWYDIFSRGNLANFQYLQNHGASGARGNQKLLMGPFGHGPLSGDLAYPGEDRLGISGDVEIRWFDYWLKGIENGIMDEPPVKFYMMASARKGALSEKNRYIEAASWPPASRKVRYYLDPDKKLTQEKPAAGIGPAHLTGLILKNRFPQSAVQILPSNGVPWTSGKSVTGRITCGLKRRNWPGMWPLPDRCWWSFMRPPAVWIRISWQNWWMSILMGMKP